MLYRYARISYELRDNTYSIMYNVYYCGYWIVDGVDFFVLTASEMQSARETKRGVTLV